MRTLPAAPLVLVLALAALPGRAAADDARAPAGRDLCRRGKVYRGTPLDLDVKNADVHELFRLLGDVGRVSFVISDGVTGKTTLRLKRVPWDQIACTVAASHKLAITIDGNVLLVRLASRP